MVRSVSSKIFSRILYAAKLSRLYEEAEEHPQLRRERVRRDAQHARGAGDQRGERCLLTNGSSFTRCAWGNRGGVGRRSGRVRKVVVLESSEVGVPCGHVR